jgi:hypothetical protein
MRLDEIVDMNPALAKLERAIDWGFLERCIRMSLAAAAADRPSSTCMRDRTLSRRGFR